MKKFIIVLGMLTLIATVYFIWFRPNNDKPPREIMPSNLPELQTSRIAMPVYVSTNDIERAIRQEINSPTISGVTPEIDAKLLGTEAITADDLVKELVSPYVPGHWIEGVREEWRSVREGYSCLLNPLKWGTCWRDVLKPFYVPFRQWVEPQAAVYRFVSKPVTKFLDKIYDVGVWINYKVYVEDLKTTFSGDAVTFDVSTSTDLVFDYKQPIFPATVSFKVKGLTSCNLKNNIKITVKFSLDNDINLNVTVDSDNTSLDFTKACVPLAVEGIDLMSYINPHFLGAKIAIGKAIEKAFVKALNKKLGDYNSDLSFKARIKNALELFNQSRKIDNNIWLLPNIEGGVISNFDTYNQNQETFLRLNVGVEGKPNFIYSIDTPAINQLEVYIKKSEFEPVVNSRLKLEFKYASASKTLTDSLRSLALKLLSKYQLIVDTVYVYPSNTKLVTAISFSKQGKHKTQVYLSGIPKFNQETSSFFVDSLDYYIKSKNIIIKIADKIASQQILAYLQKNSNWSIETRIDETLNKFASFQYKSEIGTLSGALKQLKVSEIFTAEEGIEIFIDLSGKLSFGVQPLKITAVDAIQSQLDRLLARDTNVISIPIYKVGDTATTIKDDSLTRYVVSFKEKTLSGDSIFYFGRSGAVKYYIFKNSDLGKKVLNLKSD
jgi:hypothetical protein